MSNVTKLLIIIPSASYPRKAVIDRIASEATARRFEVEILMQDDDDIAERWGRAKAVITDLDLSSELAERMKAAHPHVTMIGIHTCSEDVSIGDAMDESYSMLLKARCAIVLGLLPYGEAAAARSLAITGERGIKPSKGDEDTAMSFIRLLESRTGNKHHRTQLTLGGLPRTIADDVTEACRYTSQWARCSLFPKYESRDPRYPGAEFGFIAKRAVAGTLITARASNKEAPGEDDFVLITDLGEDGTVHVTSSKRKASLNAPLAHRIFRERPDIHYIVHSHVFLPQGVTVPDLSAPGTVDDWSAIESAVRGGAMVVNQPQHGTLILLRDPGELMPLLKENSLYKYKSELYDLAYARFQSSPDKLTSLETTVSSLNLSNDTHVLDLCCGTGASTIALQNLGLTNVDFADGSPSMLAVAQNRLGREGRVSTLEDLGNIPAATYDLVTVRQAFAYVSPSDLEKVAANIARVLKPTGRFVFNGFPRLAAGAAKSRDFEIERGNVFVRTREDNQITDDVVLHTQRTEIIDFDHGQWDAVFDINQFYQHSPEMLRDAFRRAGMDLAAGQRGNSVCYVATKSRPHHPENGARAIEVVE